MNNHFSNDLIYQLQYLEASIGKLIAMLSKYPTLNLTLNYHQILKQIVLIQIQPDSFDIRNLIQMRDEKDQLEKKVLKKEGYHIRCGHSLACEFYLISPLIFILYFVLTNVLSFVYFLLIFSYQINSFIIIIPLLICPCNHINPFLIIICRIFCKCLICRYIFKSCFI